MKTTITQTTRKAITRLVVLLAAAAAPAAFGASQTWSNAPISSAWQTAANWIGNGVPGALASSTTADIATFNTPISGGFGGAGNPITNDATRSIRSIRFDTAGCGPYVFGNVGDISVDYAHLGDVTINSAVTNPIAFNGGMRLRVPSSTNQRFDFTNNATDPKATLYFNVISNFTAGTRPWSAFLGGSNTGTNTIARIDDSAGGVAGAAGAILLDKVGAGTWILSGANDLPQKTSASTVARVQVIEGTLVVQNAASLGAITAPNINITNTGVLQIDGVSLNNAGLTLRNGGTVRMNGSGSLNGLVVGSQAALSATLRTTSASDVFTLAAFGTISGGAADSVLNVNGPGTVVLTTTTANTYVGKWSFNSGTNQIANASALGTGANANIAAGAIVDTTPQGAATYTLSTAALSASGTGTTIGSSAATILADAGGTFDLGTKPLALTFTPTSFSGDTTHPSLYVAQGTLSLGGNVFTVNNASGTALGVGTYRLISQASGSITSGGTHAVTVTGSGVGAGLVASISVSGGNVDLVVALYVPKNLVWKGGNPDATWNINTTANFDNAGSFSVFFTSDNVTFNSLGSANPTVTVAGLPSPGSVKVDTSANDYTFTGAGQITGSGSLTKLNAGTLTLGTANTYTGGTVVSNGTLRVGVNDAISGTGAGDVAAYGSGAIDLNNFNNTIGALNGNGSVNNAGGAASTLTIGNNNNSGSFSGVIGNTSGTLAVTKLGNGSQTLSAANTYSGGTTLSVGTLVADNSVALASGNLAVNGGTLDVKSSSLVISALTGSGGVIANNSTAFTNTLVVTNGGDYNGSINDGPTGRLAVRVLGGALRLRNANNYLGGTYVAGGASFLLGNTLGGFVGGDLYASNNATLGLPGGSQPPGTPITINTPDAGLVTFTSAALGNGWGSQFIGGVNCTNRFTGPVSINGVNSFDTFLGRVQCAANIRLQGSGSGGTNTTFEFISGNVNANSSQTVRMGEIVGGNSTNSGIGGGAGATTWIIGQKNTSTTFEGYISGNGAGAVSLVKSGTGSLTLDGLFSTNETDSATYTNTLFAGVISYTGTTTVSNGVLALVCPNNLSNSPTISLRGLTAVLDASQMGYISNYTTDFINTNAVLVTNSTLHLYSPQTLTGLGTIRGSLIADAGTTVAPGLSTGVLTVTNTVTLNGTVNMELNRASTPTADRIEGSAINVNGATINVTNIGSDLITGDVYQLFSTAVTGTPAAVNLPVSNILNTISYTWTNMLAVNGTIKVLSGASAVNPNPTNITSTVVGSNLQLSWPSSHIGWTLQAQTNSLNVGISGTWFDVAGSAATNFISVPIVPGNPTVFYRLKL